MKDFRPPSNPIPGCLDWGWEVSRMSTWGQRSDKGGVGEPSLPPCWPPWAFRTAGGQPQADRAGEGLKSLRTRQVSVERQKTRCTQVSLSHSYIFDFKSCKIGAITKELHFDFGSVYFKQMQRECVKSCVCVCWPGARGGTEGAVHAALWQRPAVIWLMPLFCSTVTRVGSLTWLVWPKPS